jgi:hypothetical protein
MTDVALSQEMALIDDLHAPDIFADGLSGYFFLNGNIRLTFESARASHVSVPGPINRVVVGRLVMPMEAAERMAKDVLASIEQVRSQSLEPLAPSSTRQ